MYPLERKFNEDGQIRLIRQFNPIDQTITAFSFEYGESPHGYLGRLLSITESLITGTNPAMNNIGIQQSRTVFNYSGSQLQSIQTFGRTSATRHLVSTREYHDDGRLRAITDERSQLMLI